MREHTRFEATVHAEPGRHGADVVARIAALDLDRIPDPDGVRLLVSMDEAARLVDQGFEVRLLRAAPQLTGPAPAGPERHHETEIEPDGSPNEEHDDRWDHDVWDYEMGGEG